MEIVTLFYGDLYIKLSNEIIEWDYELSGGSVWCGAWIDGESFLYKKWVSELA